MKVHELIEKLQEFDQDMEVRFEHDFIGHEKKVEDIIVYEFETSQFLMV